MNNLKEQVSQQWSKLSSQKIYVACSGGVDSITLLSILKELNWNVEALHVNYNLRGEDSIQDQKFVENYCSNKSIPFNLKSIDLGKHLEINGGNLQEEARKIRYSFFESFKRKSSTNVIALGHHFDDQMETFFMHIARKSGILGMSCMIDEHQQYIRPFLRLKKETIIEYAADNNIKWREDVTNKTNKYTRNILRNILLPKMKETIPKIEESVAILIRTFQENQKKLEKKVSPLIETITQSNFLVFDHYDTLSENEKIEILRQLDLKPGLLKALDKLRTSQKGKYISIETSHFESIFREENRFNFIKKETSKEKRPHLIIEEIDQLPQSFNTSCIYLDPKKIKGELNLRTWNIGDRMKPIGMKGSKLISDIIKDAKTPSHLKKQILVLTDEKDILWCVNIRVSALANATDESENIWKIYLK